MGFRAVLDIIPLKAELVKGSHGRIPENTEDYPIFITNIKSTIEKEIIKPTDVYNILENHVNIP